MQPFRSMSVVVVTLAGLIGYGFSAHNARLVPVRRLDIPDGKRAVWDENLSQVILFSATKELNADGEIEWRQSGPASAWDPITGALSPAVDSSRMKGEFRLLNFKGCVHWAELFPLRSPNGKFRIIEPLSPIACRASWRIPFIRRISAIESYLNGLQFASIGGDNKVLCDELSRAAIGQIEGSSLRDHAELAFVGDSPEGCWLINVNDAYCDWYDLKVLRLTPSPWLWGAVSAASAAAVCWATGVIRRRRLRSLDRISFRCLAGNIRGSAGASPSHHLCRST